MSSSHLGTAPLGSLTLAGLGGEEGGSPPPATPTYPPKGATVDAVVRLQALSGTWEICGADRAIGVDPESIQLTANEWGPDKASFDLHRSPIAIWPDIGAFTPVEVEIGGVVVWKGRINDTPLKLGAERVINVQCEGMQYHLDDDTYERIYVHSKLTDWKDIRSSLEANLARYQTAGQVQAGSGILTLGFPQGTEAVTNVTTVCAYLDLGQNVGKTITLTFGEQSFAGGGNWILKVVAADTVAELLTSPSIALEVEPHSAVAGSWNFSSSYRYVALMIVFTGIPVTTGGDEYLKISGISVFSNEAFESGNTSILKASDVVPDALERATMLLSGDYSQIEQTGFDIPDLALEKQTTPREAIEAVNAYHNWITKLDALDRFVFKARPVSPLLEIGAWPGADIEDASANSGAEIYNRAIVEATGADGSRLVTALMASSLTTALPIAISSPAPVNPSFATNAEGWTGVTRTTESSQSGPASGEWVGSGEVTAAFTGTFRAGTLYELEFWVWGGGFVPGVATLGAAKDHAAMSLIFGRFFEKYAIAWTPSRDTTGVVFGVGGIGASKKFVDSLSLTIKEPTIVDRRRFRRTKVIQVSSPITPIEGNQLAQIFLEGHTTTPFKGDAKVTPVSVRTALGGQNVHPSRLLLHTQELIRLSHMIDPDTGGVGRDGTIANVTYTHAGESADVSLDENRTNFDSLLNRLAAVQGANG